MWIYRMYFADSQEHFEYDPWGALGSAAAQRSYPYLESLLSFLELDCAQIEHQLHEILTRWECFFSTGEATCADDAMQKMGELAAQHIIVFKEYRREYKRHFAWIRAGKLSAEDFAAWSKRAQAKKKDCDDGKLSLDEFKEWLKNS